MIPIKMPPKIPNNLVETGESCMTWMKFGARQTMQRRHNIVIEPGELWTTFANKDESMPRGNTWAVLALSGLAAQGGRALYHLLCIIVASHYCLTVS